MRKYYGIIFLFFFTYCKVRANSSQDTSSLLKEVLREDEFLVLEQHVYDLLEKGYSIDQIIHMINDNSKKKHSEKEVVAIITNNKEREKYYARKNFRKTVKDIMILVGIIAIVMCMISIKNYLALLSWSPKFYWPTLFQSKTTDSQGQKNVSNLAYFQAGSQKKCGDKSKEIDYYRMPFNTSYFVDVELYKKLKKQAEYANKLGLEAEDIRVYIASNSQASPVIPRIDHRLGEQLESAQRIGLKPDYKRAMGQAMANLFDLAIHVVEKCLNKRY